jgi:hypothetical protein
MTFLDKFDCFGRRQCLLLIDEKVPALLPVLIIFDLWIIEWRAAGLTEARSSSFFTMIDIVDPL